MTRFAPLVALTLCAASPAQDAPKKYAVLIGVNEYDHPALPDLRYSVADATELAGVLKPAGYDVTLLADGQPAKPTKAAIDAALTRVLRGCRPGDTVVVAFSGHGLQFQGTKDAYFCPSDGRPSLNGKDTLVSLSKLYADMSDSFAGVKLLLVDACRNDPGPDRDAVGHRGVDADSAPNPPRGVAAFFSCSAGERAVEHKSLGHGVFFHYVLKGLKGEAKNTRGVITFNSLTDYVAGHVADEVPKLTGGTAKQSPNQKADLSGASPVLLASVATAPPDPAKAALAQGLAHYYGRGVKQDLVAAVPHFRAAAEAGNPDGLFYLGRVLRLRADPACRDWLEKADRAGVAAATIDLAAVCRTGLGGAADPDRADQLCLRGAAGVRAAAEAGDPVAMAKLAALLRTGRGGLTKDDAEATRWTRKAADAGDPEGLHWYGTECNDHPGWLTPAEADAEAVRAFRRAADAGYPAAMVSLGLKYDRGFGDPVVKSEAEAVRWYRAAADAGSAVGMNNVGVMYENGRGVARDWDEAARWYRKAGDAGHPKAADNLRRVAGGKDAAGAGRPGPAPNPVQPGRTLSNPIPVAPAPDVPPAAPPP